MAQLLTSLDARSPYLSTFDSIARMTLCMRGITIGLVMDRTSQSAESANADTLARARTESLSVTSVLFSSTSAVFVESGSLVASAMPKELNPVSSRSHYRQSGHKCRAMGYQCKAVVSNQITLEASASHRKSATCTCALENLYCNTSSVVRVNELRHVLGSVREDDTDVRAVHASSYKL